ncbi:Papain family cysteine protease [Phytophthora infestans]|uniref:Papain family cysteine protease n=1 Tax=Phytophthora infestans TaxID=4787 RepID=A0A833SKX1_PHYIN|nr:Papain family cysteine protease [Phytophthora infestans]
MHVSTLCFAIAFAASTTPAFARPMHSGIDYQRYLKEIDTAQADLDEWRSKFGDVAQKNGWMPVSEARSTDDQEEDLRQRIFLTKQSIANVQEANPNANFSIMSPFSAMTDEEFNKYVVNSYVSGNSTQNDNRTSARHLRSAGSSDLTFDVGSGTTSIITALKSLITSFINGMDTGTVQPSTDSSASALSSETSESQESYKFSDILDGEPTTYSPVTTPSPVVTKASSDSVDWSTSKCMAPIQSQGSCGSCWAFATVSAVESAQCIASGKELFVKYSEQQLVSCNTKNWGCYGGSPFFAFDYVQQNGLCSEESYPYTFGGGYTRSCSRSCAAQDTGLTGYAKVSGEDDLLRALDEHPVIVAVASANSVWKQYTGGVVSSCDSWQPDHAVVAVGYDSSSIKIRNSWGPEWGEGGYIRLARSSSKAGTCGVLIDMSTPQM